MYNLRRFNNVIIKVIFQNLKLNEPKNMQSFVSGASGFRYFIGIEKKKKKEQVKVLSALNHGYLNTHKKNKNNFG